MSSTEVLDAASISTISKLWSTFLIHSSQGFKISFEWVQLIVFAKILANEVFPIPWGPQNK